MWRRQGSVLALAATVLAVPCAAGAAAAFGPPSWPEYRLNIANNAVYDNGTPALPNDAYKVGPQVRATPVIVRNRLFIGAHETGGMYAYDLRTGKPLWHSNTPYWRHAPNWSHSDMV